MGSLAVRRADRRARPEHAGERRLREHGAGAECRRGLDPRRAGAAAWCRDLGRRRRIRHTAALDWFWVPRQRRGRHRRRGRGRRAAVRPPPARHDHRFRRGGPGRRVRRCGPRAWRPADLRDARARSPPTAPSTAPGSTSSHISQVMEQLMQQAERRGIDRHAIAGQHRVHFTRDLHARPRRQRVGRDQCAAPDLRAGRGLDCHREHEGLHGSRRWVRGSRKSSPSRRWKPGIVPPVPNFREIDPELGQLNLSRAASTR